MGAGIGDRGSNRARDIDHAIELTNGIQAYQGQGHSCGIYSTSDENIMKLAMATKTSRVLVNQPPAPSNSGHRGNGTRPTFADLGQTVGDLFGAPPLEHGTSFLSEILAG